MCVSIPKTNFIPCFSFPLIISELTYTPSFKIGVLFLFTLNQLMKFCLSFVPKSFRILLTPSIVVLLFFLIYVFHVSSLIYENNFLGHLPSFMQSILYHLAIFLRSTLHGITKIIIDDYILWCKIYTWISITVNTDIFLNDHKYFIIGPTSPHFRWYILKLIIMWL